MLISAGVALGFLLPSVARAASADDSPFVPIGSGPAPVQPTGGPLDTLELRGVIAIGGTTVATLFDTATSKAFMVQVNETANGVKVTEFSADSDSVLVESAGRSRRIPLRKATIVAMAAPPPSAPPMPMIAGAPQPPQVPNVPSPAVNAGGAPAQMSDEEVRNRMQRVAEEIRRRREMRREMLERNQPGQQPQQPTPGNPPM